MANIDDSTQTPPGYWFGVIEGRLHERMRDALTDLGLRRGSWRILHTLADGPASAEELAERLPHGDQRGRRTGHGAGHEHGHDHGQDPHERYGWSHGYGPHPGWRSQEPRDERPSTPEGGRPDSGMHEHPHGNDQSAESHAHDDHDRDHGGHEHNHHHPNAGGFEQSFERGYMRGFDRGFAFGAARGGHPATPFPGGHGYGPFPGGHGYGPFFAGRGYVAFPAGQGYGPFGAGRSGHPFADRGRRRGHRIHRVLADFVERGWVWFDGNRATLTDEGRAAHDRAFERVQTVRAELANGISEGDYAVTLATLETMARNLGWRPAGHDEPTADAPSMDA